MFTFTTRQFQTALLSAAFVASASFAGPPNEHEPTDPVPETPGPAPQPQGLAGDFNNDCSVDYNDIEFLIENDRFGTEYSFGDVLEVFANWGMTCEDEASGASDDSLTDSDAAVIE
jgi:hypothetical protein